MRTCSNETTTISRRSTNSIVVEPHTAGSLPWTILLTVLQLLSQLAITAVQTFHFRDTVIGPRLSLINVHLLTTAACIYRMPSWLVCGLNGLLCRLEFLPAALLFYPSRIAFTYCLVWLPGLMLFVLQLRRRQELLIVPWLVISALHYVFRRLYQSSSSTSGSSSEIERDVSLLSALSEASFGSPFAFVGFSCAVAIFCRLLRRLTHCWLLWTSWDNVRDPMAADHCVDEAKFVLELGAGAYLFGVSSRSFDSIFVLLPVVVLLVVFAEIRIHPIIRPYLLSPNQQGRWIVFRAVCLGVVFIVAPMLLTSYAFQTFGPTDWVFLAMAESLVTTVREMALLIKCIICAVDLASAGSAFENADELLERIEVAYNITRIITTFSRVRPTPVILSENQNYQKGQSEGHTIILYPATLS